MKVLLSFTLASLKKNRARTWITLLGIVLSMTLFTAVLTGAGSGFSWLQRNEISRNGAYHGYYEYLPAQDAEKLLQEDMLDTASVWQEVGYAYVGGREERKPYVRVMSIDENAADMAAIHLLSGRMPESPDEILLPRHLFTLGGLDYPEGTELSLELGRLTQISEWDYELEGGEPHTYRVVGTYERLSASLESYESPAYIAFTAGAEGDGTVSVLFTVDSPRSFFDFEPQGIHGALKAHSNLLAFSGEIRDNGIALVIGGFVVILLALIMIGSVALIYNSFSLSFAEREKSLGIFKSVGATKHQIRLAALQECLILCGVGIPAGCALGLAGTAGVLAYLRSDFAVIFSSGAGYIPIGLSVNGWLLLLAAALCLATVLLSVWIPARRVIRSSSLQSIRQEREIRLKHVRPGKGKLYRRIASRNYKANHRKHRITVFSLALSLVLFICATTFCDYLASAMSVYTSDDSWYDIYFRAAEVTDPEGTAKSLASLPHVSEMAYKKDIMDWSYVDTSLLDPNMEQISQQYDFGVTGFDVTLQFVDDETFAELCRANGQDPQEYLEGETPKAALFNHVDFYIYDSVGESKMFYSFDVIHAEAPFEIDYYEPIDQPDLAFQYAFLTGEDEWEVAYMPEEYYEYHENNETGYKESVFDPDAAVYMGREAIREKKLTVGFIAKERPYWQDMGSVSLVWPLSRMADVIDADTHPYDLLSAPGYTYYFKAAEHTAAFEEISAYMEEARLSGDLFDLARDKESSRMMLKILYVFSGCFIVLMAAIAALNVYHTMTTNIRLRRREFAVLRSLGMEERSFRKMLFYEGSVYLSRSLLLGGACSVLIAYGIYRLVNNSISIDRFYMPVWSVVTAVIVSVLLVFASVWSAWREEKKKDLAEEIRSELM